MRVKSFDKKLKAKHSPADSHITVGELSEKTGHEILEKYEGFDTLTEPTVKFPGQPFDRLGKKRGVWHIIEIKGASCGFGSTPGYTQKTRMQKVLGKVEGLEPCLLQIDLDAAKYKIRYGEEVLKLIEKQERKQQQIDNIIDWIKETISATE